MVVDCRSLIEFCKAFEQHRNMANSLAITDPLCSQHKYSQSRSKKQAVCLHSSSPPFCEQSSAAAVDVMFFLLAVGAFGFLVIPYLTYFCSEAAEILPVTFLVIGEVVCQAPVAYIAGALLIIAMVIGGWELFQYKSRKCDNPHCRGLKKAVEFDIQLESEQCVKSSPSAAQERLWKGGVELGDDHKELEAELRRMAPPNGRAVLVFRAPCGCPAARMEVWGAKKPRKAKK